MKNKREKIKRWRKGMRDAFFDSLFEVAKKDKRVVLITSDTGAICLDNFRKYLPRQHINIGIAEQNMIGVASGLAMAGRTVYCYGIVPFASMRCYEQIRIDLCCMNLNVNVVGIGAGFDYSLLGPTHHGTEDIALMRVLPGLAIFSSSDSIMAGKIAKFSAQIPGPKYIRLDRTGAPLIYGTRKLKLSSGLEEVKKGEDLLIISTGRMVWRALEVSRELSKHGINAAVVDLYRIKPLNGLLLREKMEKYEYMCTLEEHFISGGLGSCILEFLNEKRLKKQLLRIGIKDRFCRVYGKREYLQEKNELDRENVTTRLLKWIKNLG